jgi:hypothetical protein
MGGFVWKHADAGPVAGGNRLALRGGRRARAGVKFPDYFQSAGHDFCIPNRYDSMKYSLFALIPALMLTSCADVKVTHTDRHLPPSLRRQ